MFWQAIEIITLLVTNAEWPRNVVAEKKCVAGTLVTIIVMFITTMLLPAMAVPWPVWLQV
jgi:amino acid permease